MQIIRPYAVMQCRGRTVPSPSWECQPDMILGNLIIKMTDYGPRGGCKLQEKDRSSPRQSQVDKKLLFKGMGLTLGLCTVNV